MCDSLSSSCSQVVHVYSLPPAMSVQITLAMFTIVKNCKKILKPPDLVVQSHSRSLIFTPLKCFSLVLVMISSMSVFICIWFHTKQANSGEIVSCEPSLNPGSCDFDCWNLRLMLKISCADRLGLSSAILMHLSLYKMCVAGQNLEKFTKNPSWKFKIIQGHRCW